jgi:ParB family chromosome partitioning protein
VPEPSDPDSQPQRPSSRPQAGKKALGKGLGALIGESRAALGRSGASPSLQEGRLRELPLADISVNRRQPRRTFADEELQELAASIGALGVVQPIVVRPLHEAPADEGAPAPTGVRFELIAGERRLRAAGLAGLEYIPALVRPADEIASLEIALAENVAREDLNAIEEALAYAALTDEFGLTHERIAELVGRSRVSVTNLLRLLDLPDDVRALIERGELSEGHGRALLGLADHGERRRVARLVVAEGLTVRQVEALVRKLQEGAPEEAAATRPAAGADYGDLVDELYGVFEAPVRIRSGKRGGTIQIGFKDAAELRRLVELLRSLG